MADDWLTFPTCRTFMELLLDLGATGHWQPEDMLTLMAGECSLVSVKNSHGYEGLTQIGPSELRELGWDAVAMGEFWKALPEVQIQYTAAYFSEWRRRKQIQEWTSAGHLWMCNLAPAHLGSKVVYSELASPVQYRANRWLDANGDKTITVGELDLSLQKAVRACKTRYMLALEGLQRVQREREALACLT